MMDVCPYFNAMRPHLDFASRTALHVHGNLESSHRADACSSAASKSGRCVALGIKTHAMRVLRRKAGGYTQDAVCMHGRKVQDAPV
jgi:hypothetical protein